MGLQVRRTRTTLVALCCLTSTLLAALAPSQLVAAGASRDSVHAVAHAASAPLAHTVYAHASYSRVQSTFRSHSASGSIYKSFTHSAAASTRGLIQSCQDVRSRNPQASDGNYVISPNGDSFVVYCYNMAGQPREYLPLVQTGPGSNYSRYASGGAVYGNDVVTLFTKVRIDPQTLVADTGDLTFATSSGSISGANGVSQMPYATAADCRGGGSQTGTANIDLTGTPFIVRDSFKSTGYLPGGSAQPSANGRIVNLTGGGDCGDEEPVSGPGLVYCGCGGPSLHLQFVGLAGSAAPEEMGPGSQSTNYKPCQQTHYPINCVNGDFWHTFTDLSVRGRGIPLLDCCDLR